MKNKNKVVVEVIEEVLPVVVKSKRKRYHKKKVAAEQKQEVIEVAVPVKKLSLYERFIVWLNK